jgi:hypothetical protein
MLWTLQCCSAPGGSGPSPSNACAAVSKPSAPPATRMMVGIELRRVGGRGWAGVAQRVQAAGRVRGKIWQPQNQGAARQIEASKATSRSPARAVKRGQTTSTRAHVYTVATHSPRTWKMGPSSRGRRPTSLAAWSGGGRGQGGGESGA